MKTDHVAGSATHGADGSIEKPRYPFSGIHFIASYIACDEKSLLDKQGLIKAMGQAIEAAGATILDTCEQSFPNGGFTAIFLLAESHASIHTYPEHSSCFVDFFTCGEGCDPDKFDAVFMDYIGAKRSTTQVIMRSDAK